MINSPHPCPPNLTPPKNLERAPYGTRLRNFQKRKQKIPHEMKYVKNSDSNPRPHDQ